MIWTISIIYGPFTIKQVYETHIWGRLPVLRLFEPVSQIMVILNQLKY